MEKWENNKNEDPAIEDLIRELEQKIMNLTPFDLIGDDTYELIENSKSGMIKHWTHEFSDDWVRIQMTDHNIYIWIFNCGQY